MPASGHLPAPRLNRLFVIALLLANFGSNVALIAPIQNLLPRMIEQAAGSSGKALGLGVVTGIGALAALVFNPVAGHVSDRWRGTDNRAYTVLLGLVAGTLGHVVLAYQHSLLGIAIWWTICQAAINVAYSPMSAVIVDHVDRKSWGLVWGLVSVAQAVGLIAGLAAVVLVFPATTAGMLSVAVGYGLFLTPLVVVLRRLPRVSSASKDSGSADAGAARPRPGLIAGSVPAFRALIGGRGFRSVMAGRFLIMLAETIALLYIYYYLQDDIRYPDPGHGQLILILIATIATIMATVTVGRVADRSGGYRRYSVLASVLMAATGLALAGLHRVDAGHGVRVRPRRRRRRLHVGQPGTVTDGPARPGDRGPRPGHPQHRLHHPAGHRRARRRRGGGGPRRLPGPVHLRGTAGGRGGLLLQPGPVRSECPARQRRRAAGPRAEGGAFIEAVSPAGSSCIFMQ